MTWLDFLVQQMQYGFKPCWMDTLPCVVRGHERVSLPSFRVIFMEKCKYCEKFLSHCPQAVESPTIWKMITILWCQEHLRDATASCTKQSNKLLFRKTQKPYVMSQVKNPLSSRDDRNSLADTKMHILDKKHKWKKWRKVSLS